MAEFVRSLDDTRLNALKVHPLFNRLNTPNSGIFPAIRNNRVDFYYGGGKLLSFDGAFKTHIKYASILQAGDKDYISLDELKTMEPVREIDDDYAFARMKENCGLYAGVEAQGVADFYARHSYLAPEKERVVVLDIEIAFDATSDAATEDMAPDDLKPRLDKIDLLLFNTKTQELRFVEAKHFSNQELWSKKDTDPRVITQLERYKKQIAKNEAAILAQYAEYVSRLNVLFGTDLPMPKSIAKSVGLLIFGFGADEKKGRLTKLLKAEKGGLKGVKCYAVGKTRNLGAKQLWKALV